LMWKILKNLEVSKQK